MCLITVLSPVSHFMFRQHIYLCAELALLLDPKPYVSFMKLNIFTGFKCWKNPSENVLGCIKHQNKLKKTQPCHCFLLVSLWTHRHHSEPLRFGGYCCFIELSQSRSIQPLHVISTSLQLYIQLNLSELHLFLLTFCDLSNRPITFKLGMGHDFQIVKYL